MEQEKPTEQTVEEIVSDSGTTVAEKVTAIMEVIEIQRDAAHHDGQMSMHPF